MTREEPLRCPVCRAPFRQQRSCSRCGADLSRLMTLAAKAFTLRQFSRTALHHSDFAQSHKLAAAAQKIHPTLGGHRLSLLASWLLLPRHDITNTRILPTIDVPPCNATTRENATPSKATVEKPNLIIRSLKFIKHFLHK